jgi:hypothetical protein
MRSSYIQSTSCWHDEDKFATFVAELFHDVSIATAH